MNIKCNDCEYTIGYLSCDEEHCPVYRFKDALDKVWFALVRSIELPYEVDICDIIESLGELWDMEDEDTTKIRISEEEARILNKHGHLTEVDSDGQHWDLRQWGTADAKIEVKEGNYDEHATH